MDTDRFRFDGDDPRGVRHPAYAGRAGALASQERTVDLLLATLAPAMLIGTVLLLVGIIR